MVLGDAYYMNEALKLAKKAFEEGEIPVGAVITCGGHIIAKGYNQSNRLNDATAHAEMMAFTAASNHLGNRYLNLCTLYVTLEPCAMCAGASFWAQLGKIVFGAYDGHRGYSFYSKNILHPKTEIVGGVMADEAEALLKEFFKTMRK